MSLPPTRQTLGLVALRLPKRRVRELFPRERCVALFLCDGGAPVQFTTTELLEQSLSFDVVAQENRYACVFASPPANVAFARPFESVVFSVEVYDPECGCEFERTCHEIDAPEIGLP